MQIADYIDADLLDKFEFHNYNHAIEIITQAFPEEWREVVELSLIHIFSAGVTVGIAEIFRAFVFVIIGYHQLRHG